MKRIRYNGLATTTLALCAIALCTTLAQADVRTCPGNTPSPNGAQISTRVFNDCPTSTLTINNSYPGLISIDDQNVDCFGYANLHTWSFSTDGGATKAVYENCSWYSFCANVTLTGTGNGEGGLRLSPWWSPDADGKFMLNVGTGEIACFGGRLPFYSFTVNNGVTYTKGTNAFMEIVYTPNSLSQAQPATIEYHLRLGGGPLLSSGPLNFDEGNVTEGAVHGNWGELWQAYAGGYLQPYVGQGQPVGLTGQWVDICYQNVGATPAKSTTWGKLKTLYR